MKFFHNTNEPFFLKVTLSFILMLKIPVLVHTSIIKNTVKKKAVITVSIPHPIFFLKKVMN